jgi:hypothetical protein
MPTSLFLVSIYYLLTTWTVPRIICAQVIKVITEFLDVPL